MKKIKNTSIWYHHTIFIQLIFFVLRVSIIPVMIISTLSLSFLSNAIKETLNTSYSQIAKQHINHINETLKQYQYGLYQIANNTIIIDELLNKGESSNPYIKGKKVTSEVNKCLGIQDHSEFQNCIIYSNIKETKIYGDKVSMIEQAQKEPWYNKDIANKKSILTYLNKGLKKNILALIEPIYYIDTQSLSTRYLGFVKLDLNIEKLFGVSQIPQKSPLPYEVIVLDQNDSIMYTSDMYTTSILEEVAFDQLSLEKMVIKDNQMIYGQVLQPYQLRVIFLFQNNLLNSRYEILKKFILCILFLLIVFIGIATYYFTKSFSKRVGCLLEKMRMAEEGNLNITSEILGNDEIAILDKHFNRMIKRINELIQKNYIQQLEKQEAQLRSLQLQINPHFLYNTLETISALAAIKNAFDICDLCEKLGDIFRYSLGKQYGDYVPLEQEMRHIQNYIFIQKARFGNQFDVLYEVEEKLLKNQVLRFILQPIVENALNHGLKMKKGKGLLKISIVKEYECLHIRVEDNGVGIERNRLLDLKTYIEAKEVSNEDKQKGIGIRNVNQRIKLTCGGQYGITIKSKPNEGTCFTIKLPFIQ